MSRSTQFRGGARDVYSGMTSTKTTLPTTAAFYAQSAISFGVALAASGIGLAYLPVDPWVRAFLVIALLYTVTSAFTLAKVIRDRQEETYLVSRVDQARVDKLLAEHDPLRPEAV
jgi:hypothetical protein